MGLTIPDQPRFHELHVPHRFIKGGGPIISEVRVLLFLDVALQLVVELAYGFHLITEP